MLLNTSNRSKVLINFHGRGGESLNISLRVQRVRAVPLCTQRGTKWNRITNDTFKVLTSEVALSLFSICGGITIKIETKRNT